MRLSNGKQVKATCLQSRLVPTFGVSGCLGRLRLDIHVLLSSRNPTKLSLFCLGNTAAVVIVGSAGSAVDICLKAEIKRAVNCGCIGIIEVLVKHKS